MWNYQLFRDKTFRLILHFRFLFFQQMKAMDKTVPHQEDVAVPHRNVCNTAMLVLESADRGKS
jgi:hypothetical protein